MRRLWRLIPLASALAFVAPAGAFAFSWFGVTPRVRVDVTGVQSQAQLAEQLRRMGYMLIKLSPLRPDWAHPSPENDPYWGSRLDKIPVHDGWNGSAEKDGRRIRVWVDIH